MRYLWKSASANLDLLCSTLRGLSPCTGVLGRVRVKKEIFWKIPNLIFFKDTQLDKDEQSRSSGDTVADRRAFNPGQPRSRTVSARLRKTHLKTIQEHTKTKSEGTITFDLKLILTTFLMFWIHFRIKFWIQFWI